MGSDAILLKSSPSSIPSSSSSSSNDVIVVAATIVGIGIGVVAGTLWSRYTSPLLGNFFSKRLSVASRPTYSPGQTPSLPNPSFGKTIHTFDPKDLNSAYNLMITTITPRPIALVSTRHPTTGIDNVAPFSYFGCVGHDPPMIAIGFCRNRNGTMKDSITNILQAKEFSVQIISEWYLDAANHSCGAFPPTTDEYVESGMTKAACHTIQAPRVQEAGVSMECQLIHVQSMTNPKSGNPTTEIILAQVLKFHVDETLLVPGFDPKNPIVDTTLLKPLGRLGGNLYTTLGEIVDIPRPQVS